MRSARHHFSNGLAKAGYANRLAGFADLFEDAEALGLELGDGDFLHTSKSTMVNNEERPSIYLGAVGPARGHGKFAFDVGDKILDDVIFVAILWSPCSV